MNLQKIKRLCMAEGTCLLVRDGHGGQWIGVEDALYPVVGLELDAKSLRVIWQMTDKQAEEMKFEEREDLEGALAGLSGKGLVDVGDAKPWRKAPF